jgi:hypothetical protein
MPSSLSVNLYTSWPTGIAWYEEDHFIAGLGAITGRGTASGTAESSAESAVNFAGHPGCWALSCGTASASIASLGFPGLLDFSATGGKYAFRLVFRPTTLFTAGNTGQTFWGFFPSVIAGTAPASGAYFQYDTAISATIPNAVVAGAGSSTVPTGMTLVAGSWYDSLIVVDNVAATAEFYLANFQTGNGVFPYYGSPVSTFALTSAFANPMQTGITTIKGASGTTAVITYVDFWGLAMGGGTLSLTGASLLSMN